MKVLFLRIWVDIKLDGKSHNWYWDKRYDNYDERPTFTDESVLEFVRKHLKLDVSQWIDEVDNFGNPEFDREGFEEVVERKYKLRLNPDKMDKSDITRVMLAIYGIKTKKLNPKKASWELLESSYAPDHAINPEDYDFPKEMTDYLSVEANLFKAIDGGQEGPEMIELRSASNLALINVEFWADDEHITMNRSFFENDPNKGIDEKMYRFKAVDLIRENDHYQSEGLLIWIPELKKFGTYDPEHENLLVFPDAKPKDIYGNFGKYIAAQWLCGPDYLVKCGNVYDFYEPWKYFDFK